MNNENLVNLIKEFAKMIKDETFASFKRNLVRHNKKGIMFKAFGFYIIHQNMSGCFINLPLNYSLLLTYKGINIYAFKIIRSESW